MSVANYCDVTISQCHAIVEIGRAGQMSLNELVEQLTLDKSTVSRTINTLVESDVVVREQDPEDRRYLITKLTEQGEKVFKNIENNMGNIIIGFLSVFQKIKEIRFLKVYNS